MTDWDTWSRILDAAQDPQYRDAVQQFLAQAELSAEIPTLLDEKFLAPRRADGASGEECAYVLCNLGFAALVAGTAAAAEFAIACGQVAAPLAPGNPDLELRRQFLLSKGLSTLAVQTGQPHLYWAEALERCTKYLRAIDRHLEGLPEEAVEPNAMAAYSFSGQLLSRIRAVGSADCFAGELTGLVSAALALADRLSPALVSRLWSTTVPGTDVAALIRRTGVAAERTMQRGAESTEHASAGLAYAQELLAGNTRLSEADRGELMQQKAELLLLLGQGSDAMQIAAGLESSQSRTDRRRCAVISARHELMAGDAKAAAGLLDEIGPTSDTLVDDWCASWLGDTDDSHWTSSGAAASGLDSREVCGLQAIAAAAANDQPAFVSAADRLGGFLVDSFSRDRAAWAKRLDRPLQQPEGELLAPLAALGEILASRPLGTALVQVVLFENELLTAVARQADGEASPVLAIERTNARRLCEAHKAWSRARFDTARDDRRRQADVAAAFAGLVDEVGRAMRERVQELLEDGSEQIVFIGDDAMNLPLHALQVGAEDQRLFDRVPVSYAPSLNALRSSLPGGATADTGRTGAGFDVLAGPDSAGAAAIASALEGEAQMLAAADDGDFWADVGSSRVLHIEGPFRLNGRLPLESALVVGDSQVTAADLLTRLRFSHCDVVSAMGCESSLATMARAPGFDLAAVLLAAGARNVLASCWQTAPELAAEMTQTFFERWAEGAAPAAAFRQALKALRSARPSLPDHAWAGMRIVGAP